MLILENNTLNNVFDEKIEETVEYLLGKFDKKSEIALVLVDKKEMQNFNKDYRNKDKPTNVLSFPSGVSLEIADILGDVIICLEVVEFEAKQQNKTTENHLVHMVIHGFLHLLGYDHIFDNDAKKMEDLEVEILAELNIKNPYL